MSKGRFFSIVREIHAVEPSAAVYQIRTLQERLDDSLARQRFSTTMLGLLDVWLILAAVLQMVLRQGLALATTGVAAGLIGAAILTRVMAGLLFGVSATDAITFSTVAVVLALIAMIATYIPAHRAD